MPLQPVMWETGQPQYAARVARSGGFVGEHDASERLHPVRIEIHPEQRHLGRCQIVRIEEDRVRLNGVLLVSDALPRRAPSLLCCRGASKPVHDGHNGLWQVVQKSLGVQKHLVVCAPPREPVRCVTGVLPNGSSEPSNGSSPRFGVHPARPNASVRVPGSLRIEMFSIFFSWSCLNMLPLLMALVCVALQPWPTVPASANHEHRILL